MYHVWSLYVCFVWIQNPNNFPQVPTIGDFPSHFPTFPGLPRPSGRLPCLSFGTLEFHCGRQLHELVSCLSGRKATKRRAKDRSFKTSNQGTFTWKCSWNLYETSVYPMVIMKKKTTKALRIRFLFKRARSNSESFQLKLFLILFIGARQTSSILYWWSNERSQGWCLFTLPFGPSMKPQKFW